MDNLSFFANSTFTTIKDNYLLPKNIQLNISQKKIAFITLAIFISLISLFSMMYYFRRNVKQTLHNDKDPRPVDVFEKNIPLQEEKCKENEVKKNQDGEKVKRDESLSSLENIFKLASPITIELKGSSTKSTSSAFDIDVHNQLIVYGYGDKELHLHHLKTGVTRSIPVALTGNLFAHFLPDNQLFVGGNWHSLSVYKLLADDFIPELVSQQTCSELGPLITHLFVSDKQRDRVAVTGHNAGSILVGEKNGTILEICQRGEGSSRFCDGLCFSGDLLAVCYRNMGRGIPYIRTFSLIDGKELCTKNLQYESCISANDEIIVVGNSQGTIIGLKPSNLEQVYELKVDCVPHFGFRFFEVHEGKLFVVSSTGRFEIFDALTGTSLKTIVEGNEENSVYISEVAFADHYMAISSGKNCVDIWDFEAGEKLHTFMTNDSVKKLQFQLENKERIPYLAAHLKNGQVQMWTVGLE